MRKTKSAKLETAVHLLTAAVLLMKGFDKLSAGSHISGSIILLFGIVVLVITLFHKILKLTHMRTKSVIYVIEAIALFIIAYLYFMEKKVYLPYVYLIPAVLFLAVAVATFRKESRAGAE